MTLTIAFLLGLIAGYILGYYRRYNQLDRRIEQIQLAQDVLRQELEDMRSQLPRF